MHDIAHESNVWEKVEGEKSNILLEFEVILSKTQI